MNRCENCGAPLEHPRCTYCRVLNVPVHHPVTRLEMAQALACAGMLPPEKIVGLLSVPE